MWKNSTEGRDSHPKHVTPNSSVIPAGRAKGRTPILSAFSVLPSAQVNVISLTTYRRRGLAGTPSLTWSVSSSSTFSPLRHLLPCPWEQVQIQVSLPLFYLLQVGLVEHTSTAAYQSDLCTENTPWSSLPVTTKPAETLRTRAAALHYNQKLRFRRWHRQQFSASQHELASNFTLRSYTIWENHSVNVTGCFSDKPLAQVNKWAKDVSIPWSSRPRLRGSCNMKTFWCRESVFVLWTFSVNFRWTRNT